MRITLLAVSVGLALLGVLRAEESVKAQEKPGGLKVGVVDVLSLLENYEKSKALEKKLEERYGHEEVDLKKLQEEIGDLEGQFKIAGEAAKGEIRLKIREKEGTFKVRRDNLQETLANQHRLYTEEVYNDIKEAVAFYGKDHGYDIVLKKSAFDDPDHRQLQMEMVSNVVLFNRPDMDITTEVLNLLNARYRQAGSNKKE